MAAPPSPQAHVMVLPFPAQGHVMPLMELSHRLVEHGLEVDFVNTDFNHDRIVKAMAAETGAVPDGIHMVSFPDGMGPDGDRTDIAGLADGLPGAMLGPLEGMIRSKKIRWVIADVSMSWALELVATAGVRVALFSTFSAAVFVIRLNVPKLIEDGIFDESGNVKRNGTIRLSPEMLFYCDPNSYEGYADKRLSSAGAKRRPVAGRLGPTGHFLPRPGHGSEVRFG